ncbi:MAG: hypothetical protein J7M06_06680 [Proteobacteria bacterium]|nr:hypothetical protein [Pseudomonadota bacterium]
MSKPRKKIYFPKGKLWGGILIIFVFLQIAVSIGWAAVNVAILPFKTEGDDDIAYLRYGIEKILCSRIALGGKIHVIEQSDTKEVLDKKNNGLDIETIQSIGYHLDADYIIKGVVIKRGDRLKIDGEIVVINSNESPSKFSVDCDGIDEVIGKASQLANDLQKKLIELQNKAGYQETLLPYDKEESLREERISPGE